MKSIYKVILIATIGLFISCDEDLDINRNPNTPNEINAGLALTSAEASLAMVVGDELTNLGGFYAQYHTQSPSASQYESIDQYNLNTGYANRFWTELYSGCLNDLKYVKEESDAAGDTASALISELLRAYTYQLLVDLFDDIPYTEALQQESGNITPALTSGEEVYADLLDKIDAAVAAYNTNPTEAEVASQDVIYGGNMDRWIEFANTLKLKMYLRMAYTSMADPGAVNALMAEGNFLTADAAFTNFAETDDKRNPFYEVQFDQTGLGDVNHIASNTLLFFYEENQDPRITAVYRANDDGDYVGIEQGTGNDFNDTALAYARPNVGPLTPVFFMSVTESYFLQAEALVRYSGGAGAKEMYDMAVAESFETYANYFGLGEDADATEFTGAGGVYEYTDAGSTEANIRQIMVQKWASLPYINNIESYIETTRTKFPEVVTAGTQDYAEGNRIPSAISVLGGTAVPSILFYPDDEVNRNPNITQRANITENVWWDQKPE